MTIISTVTHCSYRRPMTNAWLSAPSVQVKFSSFLKLTMEPISTSLQVIKFDNYPDFIKMHNRLHPQSQINQRYVSQVRCQPDQEITGKIGVIYFFYINDTRDNFWLNDFMGSEKSKQILANLELQTRRFKMFNWILSWVKLAISFVWFKKKKNSCWGEYSTFTQILIEFCS